MEQSKVTRLSKLVDVVDACIGQLRADGYAETALLFEMARLDLQTRLHDISAQDLKDLCSVIEKRGSRIGASPARPRGDALTTAGRSSARQRLRSSDIVQIASKDNRHA